MQASAKRAAEFRVTPDTSSNRGGTLPPTERNILLGQGLATYSLDSSDIPIIERLVTTYTHGREGAPDPSYQDTETMRALTYLLISWKTRTRGVSG